MLRDTTDQHRLGFVGNSIKEARKRQGFTQKQLAEICNIEKANYSRIESGKSNITVKTLYCISMALQIELHLLLSGVHE